MSFKGWEEVRLEEIIDIEMGQSPKSEFYNSDGNGLPFLQGNRTFGTKYPYFDTFCTDSKKVALKNDVMMSVRAPVGDLNIAQRDICIGRGVCAMRLKNSENSEFLFYLMKYNIKEMINCESGTVFGSVNKKDILGLTVITTSNKKEQESIANILSTLDDKIEVNNRINKTLESMAQEIFKRWFVDFEFPNEEGEPFKSSGGEMVESELGLIPKEWKVEKIGEMCEVTSSKRIFAKEYVSKGVPFYRGKEIIEKSKGNSITTELYISRKKYSELRRNHPVPQKGDMLLTSVGTLGKAYIVDDEEFYFKDGNLTWFRDYQNEGYSEYIYWWIKSKSGIEMLDAITIGSTQKALTINVLKNIKLVISDNFLSKKFYPLFAAINNNIKNINKENESIRMTRDLLLPKLMSGEIRVPLEES